MVAVDVVRRLPFLVGLVQEAAIFGVSQEQLRHFLVPEADGYVQGRVPTLPKERDRQYT